MRLVLLTLLLLIPSAACAAEVLVAVGMQFLPFWAQVAITVVMSVYGAQQARRPHQVQDEFPGYVWADSKSKEIPVKELDDGMDMTRYTALRLNIPGRAKVVTVESRL